MPGPQFFETMMGRKFYEGTMPRLATALADLAKSTEEGRVAQVRQNELLGALLERLAPKVAQEPLEAPTGAVEALMAVVNAMEDLGWDTDWTGDESAAFTVAGRQFVVTVQLR